MEVDCIGCGMFQETGGLYQYLSRLYEVTGGKLYENRNTTEWNLVSWF